MKKAGYVTAAQLQGYDNPSTNEIVVATETASDEELVNLLLDVTSCRGLMTNFLPLPFTADSLEGRRVTAAWDAVVATFPHKTGFTWRFYDSERDTEDAAFMHVAIGAPMLPVYS